MPIYTKTGDKGTTSVFGGRRLSKSELQIKAYGSADELSSILGLVLEHTPEKGDKKLLLAVQKDLYVLMSYLADAKVDITFIEGRVKEFERYIDSVTSQLPKLHSFILPGGTEKAAWQHIARAVSRRAEREIVTYFETKKSLTKDEQNVLQYFNRLSDLFFTLARKYGQGKEQTIKM